MKKALVTLAIGEQYVSNFNHFCRDLWLQYAEKQQFDLIVFTEPLDDSSRAKSRSPAWQKCLILSQPLVQKYDQVVWVDSDIMINPNSPDICSNVPIQKVGAVDDYATPSKEEHRFYLERFFECLSKQGVPFKESYSATDYHRDFGLDKEFACESVVQTGVLVLSPKYHRDLFEHVYYHYEDKGSSAWNYEMRPLSYEILNSNLEYWVSPKFNMPWPFVKEFMYPFLSSCRDPAYQILGEFGFDLKSFLTTKCVTTAFLSNYFLHFAAGSTRDMAYVDTEPNSVYDL